MIPRDGVKYWLLIAKLYICVAKPLIHLSRPKDLIHETLFVS